MSEPRRDQWGRYLVVPPGGSSPIGYTRATTIAKTLDDGGGLIPWKATATMVGALRRSGLMARWQALMAQHADPWYGSTDSKNACKKLVEECAEAGGSTDRADMGTALHAIIEQQLIGTPGTPLLQPNLQADIDAFRTAITTAGITFDQLLIEAVVVLDRHQVAGTADQLCTTVPGLGCVVSDLKTGTDLKYSWQAIAMQLAIYANANAVYVQGEAKDGSLDRRLPMPELSREVGLVIHLPAGEARCEIYEVDLVAGWEAFEHAMWVRGWRGRKDLAKGWVKVERAGATPTEPLTAVVTSAEPPPFEAEPEPASTPAPPSPSTPAEQLAAIRKSPDEGGLADEAAFAVLERHYSELPQGKRVWITALAKSAQNHGVSFHAKEAKTIRRFEIIRGLVALALADSDDDETLRAVLASVVGDVAHFPAVAVAHVLGSMTAGEAAIFARRVDEFISQVVPASIDESGRLVLHFEQPTAA